MMGELEHERVGGGKRDMTGMVTKQEVKRQVGSPEGN